MKKHQQKDVSNHPQESLAELYHRLERDMLDSFDEELEMELDDQRFDESTGSAEDIAQARLRRRQYFKELLRLQGELVKLQDWVAHTGYAWLSFSKGEMQPVKVESSSGLHND